MSVHANNLENITGGLLMSLMIAAERGRMRARDRREQAQAINAHNAGVARIRAARRQRATIAAQQVKVGEQRMARWIDRVAH